jgi:hypothetical protein
MSEPRTVAPHERPDDAPDSVLRPQLLSEFVGQAQACPRSSLAVRYQALQPHSTTCSNISA